MRSQSGAIFQISNDFTLMHLVDDRAIGLAATFEAAPRVRSGCSRHAIVGDRAADVRDKQTGNECAPQAILARRSSIGQNHRAETTVTPRS